jgi:hypothetical protein
MNHDVFVSYSSPNREVAEAACAALEGRGMKCWIAPRDVTAGESWSGEIVEAIAQAKLMVLVFSSQANASKHVLREVERAVHHGIPIIPLRIEKVRPTKELEYFLSVKHWLEAESRPIDPHLVRLAETIQGLLSRGPRASPAAVAADPTESASASRPVQPAHSARPVSSFSSNSPGSARSNPAEERLAWKRRAVLAGLAATPLLIAGVWRWTQAQIDAPTTTDSGRTSAEPAVAVVPEELPRQRGDSPPPAGRTPPIDLLAQIDDIRDAESGWIVRRGGQLVIARGPAAKNGVILVIPWRPPAAYRLHLRIRRLPESKALIVLGLASAGHLFSIRFDGEQNGLRRTGIATARRGELEALVSTADLLIKQESFVDLVVTVDPQLVDLRVGAEQTREPALENPAKSPSFFTYRGAVSTLQDDVPGRRGTEMFLGSTYGFVLERLELEPLADDPGRPLRTPEPEGTRLP